MASINSATPQTIQELTNTSDTQQINKHAPANPTTPTNIQRLTNTSDMQQQQKGLTKSSREKALVDIPDCRVHVALVRGDATQCVALRVPRRDPPLLRLGVTRIQGGHAGLGPLNRPPHKNPSRQLDATGTNTAD